MKYVVIQIWKGDIKDVFGPFESKEEANNTAKELRNTQDAVFIVHSMRKA